jgi:hypothetical protein
MVRDVIQQPIAQIAFEHWFASQEVDVLLSAASFGRCWNACVT